MSVDIFNGLRHIMAFYADGSNSVSIKPERVLTELSTRNTRLDMIFYYYFFSCNILINGAPKVSMTFALLRENNVLSNVFLGEKKKLNL